MLRGGMRVAITAAREKLREVLEAGSIGLVQMPEEGVYSLDALVATQQEHHRGKLALLLARNVAAITTAAQALAGQLRRSEAGLRAQVCEYVGVLLFQYRNAFDTAAPPRNTGKIKGKPTKRSLSKPHANSNHHQVEQFNEDPSMGASSGKHPTQVRVERDAVAALQASVLEELRLFPSFVRLLDCLVLQNHFDLIVAAVEGVQVHQQRPGALAEVRIVMGEEGQAGFEPSQEEFLKVRFVLGSMHGVGSKCSADADETHADSNKPYRSSARQPASRTPISTHEQQAMGRSVVESLVSVIKEVPCPSRHPTLAPLLAQQQSTSEAPTAAGRAKAAAQPTGFAFVSVDAAATAAAAAATTGATAFAGGSSIVAGTLQPSSSSAAAATALAAARLSAPREGHPVPGHQITMMTVGDSSLAKLRRSCDIIIMRSYREAARVGERLGELGTLFRFTRGWDAKTYKGRVHTIGSLRQDAALLREWILSLQSMVSRKVAGCLQLQAEALKTTHLETLKVCMWFGFWLLFA